MPVLIYQSLYDNIVNIVGQIAQKVSRIKTNERKWSFLISFDNFRIEGYFWGIWGSSENWLEPKINPPNANLTKLRLSKSEKLSVATFYISFQNNFKLRIVIVFLNCKVSKLFKV